MKDVLRALLAMLMLSAELARDWWDFASKTQKIVVGVVLGVVLLGLAQCVRAEPAGPDTNYQLLETDGTPGIALCPLQSGVAESGVITLCLLGMRVGEEQFVINGTSSYCVVTGMKNDRPYWTCGSYEELRAIKIGI